MNTSQEKSALVLIETQNEWMHQDGKLRKTLVDDENIMMSSIRNIERALAHARAVGLQVIYVGLRFEKGYPELGKGESGLRKAIPNAGTFSANDFGAKFYDPVRPVDGDFVVTGRTGASGFAGSNLDSFLRNNGITTLYLAGYATHVCVESTLREAHDKGYDTYIVSDATAAFNQAQHDYVLKEVVHHYGKHLTTADFTFIKPQEASVSATPLRAFFQAFGEGNVQGIINTFHERANIIAVREGKRKANELYGSYSGIEGVKEFLTNLGNTFDTQSFNVTSITVGDGKAFATGNFVHKIKSTGNLFASDWALVVTVLDNKIVEYRFFEDSAAFEEATITKG